MTHFINATTNTFCDEEIQDVITGFPDVFHQPEDVNEWMVGSQTDIRRKHRLLKKLKIDKSIKPDITSTSPETSLILPAYQESTKNTYITIERDNPLKKFIDILEVNDKNTLLEALVDVKRLSNVEKIEFEDNENPTLIIRLSEMNREIEENIYQIEYDLLKSFKNNIDFLVLPV